MSRPCANCGRQAVDHWVRPGIGAMYCERKGSDRYDRGELTPEEQAKEARLISALGLTVAILAGMPTVESEGDR